MWKGDQWDEFGEVMDNAGNDSSNVGAVQATKMYPGDEYFPADEYDHIFDVELGDGIMRKLPFNNGADK